MSFTQDALFKMQNAFLPIFACLCLFFRRVEGMGYLTQPFQVCVVFVANKSQAINM